MLSVVTSQTWPTYNKNCKVGEVVAATGDNSILADSSIAAFWGPVLKVKVP